MQYIIINVKTLECLCQTKPINFKCWDYWADTVYNPYTGRCPVGSARVFSSLKRAKEVCELYKDCEVAEYDCCMNQIHRLSA